MVPASDLEDETAGERATDEGMPEDRPSAVEAQAAERAAAHAAALDGGADDIEGGWIGPTESDDRRGIEDDPGEHDEGGEG